MCQRYFLLRLSFSVTHDWVEQTVGSGLLGQTYVSPNCQARWCVCVCVCRGGQQVREITSNKLCATKETQLNRKVKMTSKGDHVFIGRSGVSAGE